MDHTVLPQIQLAFSLGWTQTFVTVQHFKREEENFHSQSKDFIKWSI